MKYRYLETRLGSARLGAFSSFREKENRIARVGRVPTDTRELPVPASRGPSLLSEVRSVSNDYYVEARIAFNYARRGVRARTVKTRGGLIVSFLGQKAGIVCRRGRVSRGEWNGQGQAGTDNR